MKKTLLISGLAGFLMINMASAAPPACDYVGKTCSFNFKAKAGQSGLKKVVSYILVSGSDQARAQVSLPAGATRTVQGDCDNAQIQAIDLTTVQGSQHPMYNYKTASGFAICFNPAQVIDVTFDPADPHWVLTGNPLD